MNLIIKCKRSIDVLIHVLIVVLSIREILCKHIDNLKTTTENERQE